jgi:hypothetical protein
MTTYTQFPCRTSDSNFLNSSSFSFLYASISFFASSLASFTRFVRSGSFHQSFLFRGRNIDVDIYSHSLARRKEVSAPQYIHSQLQRVTNLSGQSSVHLFPPMLNQYRSPANPNPHIHQAAFGYPPNSVPTICTIKLANVLQVAFPNHHPASHLPSHPTQSGSREHTILTT